MLLRFAFENFRSFRDPTELSFVATARKDPPEWRMPSRHVPHGVLPVLGVWGANASGKSNLLNALLHLRRLVRDSWSRQEPHEPAPWSPWRLRKGPDAPPMRMELEFLVEEDVRLSFGFKLGEPGFVEEWLYRWERSRRQVLYHRDRSQAEPWHFGSTLKGQRAQIARATRDNSLFLSAAAQHNHSELLPIYEAIVTGVSPGRPIELQGYPLFAPDAPLLAPDFRPVLLDLLAKADLGVVDLHTEEFKPDNRLLPAEAKEIFQPGFLEELQRVSATKNHLVQLRLRHGNPGESWDLPPEHESRGTQVLLARLDDLMHVLRHGGVLVLDELDTSLHPDLCAALVGLFTDKRSNPKGAQLLFSTHDRDLLRQLRTDEVVLVDKDRDGVSWVAAASDYRLRTRDDMRQAHEQGRLRGVPVLGDLIDTIASRVHGET